MRAKTWQMPRMIMKGHRRPSGFKFSKPSWTRFAGFPEANHHRSSSGVVARAARSPLEEALTRQVADITSPEGVGAPDRSSTVLSFSNRLLDQSGAFSCVCLL